MPRPSNSRSPDTSGDLDELLQRVHAIVCGGEGMPPADVVARGQLRARWLNETEQHAIGYADGFEAGYDAAHRDMAEWFALVSRLVRQRAGHPSHAERASAEAEWVKPRPGDYTGQLSPAEYFGTEPPQLRSLERRAA